MSQMKGLVRIGRRVLHHYFHACGWYYSVIIFIEYVLKNGHPYFVVKHKIQKPLHYIILVDQISVVHQPLPN